MEYPVKNFDEILSNVFMFPTKKGSNVDKENLITNSAFKLKNYNDEEIILEQNENYWDNINTKIKKVTLKLVENDLTLEVQQLLGDGIAHSAYPGIMLAFMFMGVKTLDGLLLGAFFSALKKDI